MAYRVAHRLTTHVPYLNVALVPYLITTHVRVLPRLTPARAVDVPPRTTRVQAAHVLQEPFKIAAFPLLRAQAVTAHLRVAAAAMVAEASVEAVAEAVASVAAAAVAEVVSAAVAAVAVEAAVVADNG